MVGNLRWEVRDKLNILEALILNSNSNILEEINSSRIAVMRIMEVRVNHRVANRIRMDSKGDSSNSHNRLIMANSSSLTTLILTISNSKILRNSSNSKDKTPKEVNHNNKVVSNSSSHR